MIDIIKKIWKVGTVTQKEPLDTPPPEKFRGKIKINQGNSAELKACVQYCPTGALTIQKDGTVGLFHGKCIFCGNCVRNCTDGSLEQTKDYFLAVKNKEDLYYTTARAQAKKEDCLHE